MQKSVKYFLQVCVLFLFKPIIAQDIRAAWIEYKWMYGYTYSFTIVILDDNTDPTNHCGIAIYFGDGDSGIVYRDNGPLAPSSSQCSVSYAGDVISITPPIRKSIYHSVHSYSGPGSYNTHISEPFRVAGINNLTNSPTKGMWIEAQLPINQFSGPNSTPIFSAPPFTASKDSLYTYNLGLYDPDGDSLSYHLVNCAVTPTTSYYIPVNCSINSMGTFTYQTDTVGLFAFKVLVKEWRSSQIVGTNEIDFTIEVKASVGIDELEKQKNISLYPNPTSNVLNINTDSHPKEIEITNALGQTIQKHSFSKTIDVSKLEPGCYFIRIGNSYAKFIRN